MSSKARSNALRKLLAENIEQSAATPAPLTLTGAGTIPAGPSGAVSSIPAEVMTPDSCILGAESFAPSLAVAEAFASSIAAKSVSPPPIAPVEPLATILRSAAAVEPALVLPAPPRPEKLSVLLNASELAILERFHEDARGAGIKMRKGGNPSLFVRAALQLLDEVGSRNADEWARIIAASIRDSRA